MFVCLFFVGFMFGNGESAAKQGYQPSPSCGKPNSELVRIYKKLCVRVNHQKTMPKIGGFKVLFESGGFHHVSCVEIVFGDDRNSRPILLQEIVMFP